MNNEKEFSEISRTSEKLQKELIDRINNYKVEVRIVVVIAMVISLVRTYNDKKSALEKLIAILRFAVEKDNG